MLWLKVQLVVVVDHTSRPERRLEIVKVLVQGLPLVKRARPEIEVPVAALPAERDGVLHGQVGGAGGPAIVGRRRVLHVQNRTGREQNNPADRHLTDLRGDQQDLVGKALTKQLDLRQRMHRRRTVPTADRKSTLLNSRHLGISYAV